MLVLIFAPKGNDQPWFESGESLNSYDGNYLNSYDGRYAEHQGSGFKNKMEKDQKDNI